MTRMNWMLRTIMMPLVRGCRDDVTTRRCAARLELVDRRNRQIDRVDLRSVVLREELAEFGLRLLEDDAGRSRTEPDGAGRSRTELLP